jgi:diphthamide synthase (EF-2-diphthine--ammonia ligase)
MMAAGSYSLLLRQLVLAAVLLLLLLFRLPGTGKTTAQIAAEMMAAGFKAVIACCDPKRLPASFAGRLWDQQLLQDLPADVDPCGEVGEIVTNFNS